MEGFAWLHGPGFLGHRAQRSFDVWRSAEKRAVVPLTSLRHVEATPAARRCVAYAFWTHGPPGDRDVRDLMTQAGLLDANTLRLEALPYTELSPWRGLHRAYEEFTIENDAVALALSDPPGGRYVFTQVDRGPTSDSGPVQDGSLVVWARLHGIDHLYPVPANLQC